MLDKKHKLPKDRFKYGAPYFGFALCCGVKPKVDFNPSDPNAKYRVGHMVCPVCDKQLGVISNGDGELPDRVGFLYQAWNRELPNSPLFNVPEGFFWCEARAEYKPHGETFGATKYFLILKVKERKVFNFCPYRNEIVELEFPKPSYNMGACFTETSWSGGDRQWRGFYFTAYNYKWKNLLENFLVVNLDPRGYGY